jgi:hypothetical protein
VLINWPSAELAVVQDGPLKLAQEVRLCLGTGVPLAVATELALRSFKPAHQPIDLRSGDRRERRCGCRDKENVSQREEEKPSHRRTPVLSELVATHFCLSRNTQKSVTYRQDRHQLNAGTLSRHHSGAVV